MGGNVASRVRRGWNGRDLIRMPVIAHTLSTIHSGFY